MSKHISFSMITTLVLLFALFSISHGGDTITRLQSIKDSQTLVSAGGSFVLGFFSPGNSISRYLGIWFAVSNETVVWVANRDRPLNDSTGVLQIDSTGNLLLTNKANAVLWTSRLPTSGSTGNTVARLLETGNLVLVRDGSSGDVGASVLWQSFDYPTDTLLANMKLGPDYKAGRNRSLTSWRDVDDPAPGDFTYSLDTRGLVQPVVYDQRSLVFRSGPWNGIRFSGTPEMASYDMFNFTIVNNREETYYEYGVTKPGIFARLAINSSGSLQRLVWDGMAWKTFWSGPKDQCDRYAWCGSYGLCDTNNAPICGCLPGFQPKNPEQWYLRNWNAGCKRKTELNCSNGDGFKLVQQTKLPDTVNSTVNMSMSLKECEEMCLKNCSCTAYSSANISGGGSGCLMWTGDLVDIRVFTANGQDLYLRLAASELDAIARDVAKKKKTEIIIIVTVVIVLILFLVIGGCCLWRKKKRKLMRIEDGQRKQGIKNKSVRSTDDPELPIFDFDSTASATNFFSDKNRIGKGGFGIVYKGMLDDGREVAVKRLSMHSGQGIDEFMTEVMLIAKLQHRNLVRLLGCCIEGEERMLIYEYMPNGSLDAFIFGDRRSRSRLDWRKRLDIILGVARGLLYLHQDSRLRIIHRDLKAGNILLDGAMNPKISDFGTARIFGNDQMDENTVRIVGTIGYMSPEYAMDGNFSEKSDVFSFGVLVLEIISGRKNRWISQKDLNQNLLARAWRLWIEDHCGELIDDTLRGPCPFSDVLKCIQVGLLCVQESAAERPTMQRVVLMLSSDNPSLPQPKKPGFFKPANPSAADSASSGQESCSINMITLTGMESR